VKLFEILQDDIRIRKQPVSKKQQIHKTKRISNTYIKNKLKDSPDSILGAGIDAVVFHSSKPQNAGVVTKWVRDQKYDAKNNTYVQYLIKNQNNPYVPVVYSITQHNLQDGEYSFSIQMEKLHNTVKEYLIININDEHLFRVVVALFFTDESTDYLMRTYFHENPKIIIKLMCSVLDDHTVGYDVNPQLSAIIEKIHNVITQQRTLYGNSRVGVDLHLENVMIRLTSVGPQLVITDPYLEN
jgi:hypothetical protein